MAKRHPTPRSRATTRWRERHAPIALALVAGILMMAQAAGASAQASEHPRRAPGLWEVRSAGAHASGLPPTRFCVGEDTDNESSQLDRSVGKRGACTLGPFRRAGSSWVAESVCRQGRTSVTSRSVASGDFESAYRIDTVVQYDPPLGGVRRDDKDAVVASRLGACEPGQKPGDMVMPGMGTLNMFDGSFRAEPPQRSRSRRSEP
ncbi:DUF3617 domain-containing protein [Quisquiliibacterium transsilvanicum]|uniref:DUF3617 family protein n=1 Tax=Quisquiliibacterium transsilvanicum TaxID=1549638 RepID=A0A7W8HFP6_9BURK|nr:DUF3617 family protein [Quisquiliibacterium transsilvanicum]MBB5270606.1 hypothetical protein [Quisquiliibacterium transsilvanicum]